MILSTAAFLSLLGIVVWVLGHQFGYRGIATIGAVMMVGVGAGVMLGGLEIQTGETQTGLTEETALINETSNTTEVRNATANQSVTVQYSYESIQTSTSFPLGMILTLLGGTMTARALEGSEI